MKQSNLLINAQFRCPEVVQQYIQRRGGGAFANSTVVQYINNPDFASSKYPSLESAWRAWNRTQGAVSNGLINRRNDEWNMYNNGAY